MEDSGSAAEYLHLPRHLPCRSVAESVAAGREYRLDSQDCMGPTNDKRMHVFYAEETTRRRLIRVCGFRGLMEPSQTEAVSWPQTTPAVRIVLARLSFPLGLGCGGREFAGE